MSRTSNGKIQCNFCRKLSGSDEGFYAKPDGRTGYIHSPDWDKDGPFDTCEECAEKRCPWCGSTLIINVTPAIPGPTGWGGRCKSCGERWSWNVGSVSFT